MLLKSIFSFIFCLLINVFSSVFGVELKIVNKAIQLDFYLGISRLRQQKTGLILLTEKQTNPERTQTGLPRYLIFALIGSILPVNLNFLTPGD